MFPAICQKPPAEKTQVLACEVDGSLNYKDFVQPPPCIYYTALGASTQPRFRTYQFVVLQLIYPSPQTECVLSGTSHEAAGSAPPHSAPSRLLMIR